MALKPPAATLARGDCGNPEAMIAYIQTLRQTSPLCRHPGATRPTLLRLSRLGSGLGACRRDRRPPPARGGGRYTADARRDSPMDDRRRAAAPGVTCGSPAPSNSACEPTLRQS